MHNDTPKEENKHPAKNESLPESLPAALPAAKAQARRVRCNGGVQGSGHPAVYLSLNDEGFVVCPYCSQRFGKENKKSS